MKNNWNLEDRKKWMKNEALHCTASLCKSAFRDNCRKNSRGIDVFSVNQLENDDKLIVFVTDLLNELLCQWIFRERNSFLKFYGPINWVCNFYWYFSQHELSIKLNCFVNKTFVEIVFLFFMILQNEPRNFILPTSE